MEFPFFSYQRPYSRHFEDTNVKEMNRHEKPIYGLITALFLKSFRNLFNSVSKVRLFRVFVNKMLE